MADFLLKTEPSDYSFDDLVKEKQTVWTGVEESRCRSATCSPRRRATGS